MFQSNEHQNTDNLSKEDVPTSDEEDVTQRKDKMRAINSLDAKNWTSRHLEEE